MSEELPLPPELEETLRKHGIDPETALATEGIFRRPLPDRSFPSAVTFVPWQSSDRREMMAYPQAIFRGDGLWLWGTDESTLVHNLKVGNQNCFALSSVAIPGLYFQAGMTFEDFEKLLESPRDEWTHERLRRAPEVPKHQAIRMLTAEVGNSIVLDVSGPLTHAVVWGKTVL